MPSRRLSGVPEVDEALAGGISPDQLALISAAGLPVPNMRSPSEWKQVKLDNFARNYSRPWPPRAREEEFKREYQGTFRPAEPEPTVRPGGRPFFPPSFTGEEMRIAEYAASDARRTYQLFAAIDVAVEAMSEPEPEPEIQRKSIWEWVRNPAV